MCIGGGAPSLPPPPAPVRPPPVPKQSDKVVRQAYDDERKRAALETGRSGDIATTALGLTTLASTTKKKVLGA